MRGNLFFPDSHCAKCRDDGKMEPAVVGICMSLLTGLCPYIAVYCLATSEMFSKIRGLRS